MPYIVIDLLFVVMNTVLSLTEVSEVSKAYNRYREGSYGILQNYRGTLEQNFHAACATLCHKVA